MIDDNIENEIIPDPLFVLQNMPTDREYRIIYTEDSYYPVLEYDLTEEDIAWQEELFAENQKQEIERQIKIDNYNSAIEKLQKLGLTEDEARAVIGFG